MRWCLIIVCICLAPAAAAPPTTAGSVTTVSSDSSTVDPSTEAGTAEPGTTESVTATSMATEISSLNSTEALGNFTVGAPGNSSDPQCKSDEKLIEDATNCHVLCSKGALFYYSAGRKPNGTECVINKYVEGTKHIESSKPGDCFKGQCILRNGTSTTPATSTTPTTIAPTTIMPTTIPTTSSEIAATTGASTEAEMSSTSSTDSTTAATS